MLKENMRFTPMFFFMLVNCTSSPSRSTQWMTAAEVERLISFDKKIVIVSHPSCGFSERAFNDITPDLWSYFHAHAIVLAPIDKKHYENHFRPVEESNYKTDIQYTAIMDNVKIPPIDLGTTPQFYFFKNGVLMQTVTGWPKDKSNLKKLEMAVQTLEK